MKNIFIGVVLLGLAFSGCNSTSYQEEKVVHNKYYKQLQIDPNFKVNAKDLDLIRDIEDSTIFCYSTATTTQQKMQKLIEGLRTDIPIDCNTDVADGDYNCLVENEILNITAKENATKQSNGESEGDVKDMAEANGYHSRVLYSKTFVQEHLSEREMILSVERKMKNDPEFCSYVVGKNTVELGVGYATKGDKRYWTLIWAEEK